MGYEVTIRGLIASVLSPQFESMKQDVTHTPWVGQDGKGGDHFGTPQTLRALVEFKGAGTVRVTPSGVTIVVMAELTFLDPIPETATEDPKFIREGPIDGRDKLTLPDGSTGIGVVISDSGSGFVDSGTGNPFATTVTLGTVVRGD